MIRRGCGLRIARNFARLWPVSPAVTVELFEQGFFMGESANRILEEYFCRNSGVDEDTASRHVSVLLDVPPLASMGLDQFDGSDPGPYWEAQPQPQRPPRVVEVAHVAPEELAQWLAATDLTNAHAEQIAALGEKFGLAGPKELAEIIRLVRSVRATKSNADFRNPFAILGLQNSVAQAIFGDKLEFGALLNTQECRFLLDNWRDGYRFDEVCDVLDAACGSIETAGELLYT
jgi:hypothetical protein